MLKFLKDAAKHLLELKKKNKQKLSTLQDLR